MSRRPARPGRGPRHVGTVALFGSLILAMVGLVVPAAMAQEASAPPRASLTSGSGAPGSTVLVVGEGWPASSVVQAQVCGNQALNGSADCLRSGAVTQGTDDRGGWNAELPVDVPPTPCPCVVYVTGVSGSTALRLPFDVSGVPSSAPNASASAVPVYRVTGFELDGGATVGSLLGASSARTVSLTVENSGAAPIPSLPVVARVGDGDHPATVAATATIGPLTPGQSETVEMAVTIPALTLGTSTVEAIVGAGSQTVSRSGSVTTWPWLLFVVLAALIVGLVVLGAVVVARRRSRPAAQDTNGEQPPDAPPPGPPADDVIDLRTGELILGAGAGVAAAAAAGSADRPPVPAAAPQVDPVALEQDLADELELVLADTLVAGRGGTSADAAAGVAAEVAAVVGARHGLDPSSVQALASELRASLEAELRSVAPGTS